MARRPHLDPADVAELELFDELADHLDVQEDELLEEIVCEGKDSRRRFTGTLRASIYQRDGGACFYCGARLEGTWHADHVIPHSRGGRTVASNGVAACPSCNLRKSNKVEWDGDEGRWVR